MIDWSILDEHLIVILGGTNASGEVTENTEILSMPASSSVPACPSIKKYVFKAAWSEKPVFK